MLFQEPCVYLFVCGVLCRMRKMDGWEARGEGGGEVDEERRDFASTSQTPHSCIYPLHRTTTT